jgi:hypothetical protein
MMDVWMMDCLGNTASECSQLRGRYMTFVDLAGRKLNDGLFR